MTRSVDARHDANSGWRDPLTRFSNRAEGYDKYRPDYPAEAIDSVLEGFADRASLIAIDIGAGTGISSRMLAARGLQVIAVEPNHAMLEVGRARADNGAIEWRPPGSTAEETGLPDACADIVLCAQAFHWVDRDRALAEFHRILKTGGRAAVIWNVQDQGDPFTAAYHEVILKHATDAPTSPSFTGHQSAPRFEPPLWKDARRLAFAHAQMLDEEGLIGRAGSSSYCPPPGVGTAREALEADLRKLFAQWSRPARKNGVVRLAYCTEVHMAQRG